MVEDRRELISYIAIASGFSTLFYAFYYMQQISFSIGYYTGIASVTSNAVAETGTLSFGLHVTYVMLIFAVLILIIGIVWLFSKSHYKRTSVAMGFAAIIYLLLVFLLQSDLTFSTAIARVIFSLAYVAGALGIVAAGISFSQSYNVVPRKAMRQIEIDSAMPYTNMLKLSSRLDLSGTIRILDMHIDHKALDNLLRILGNAKGRYTGINILTTMSRLGSEFEKGYNDFKEELTQAHVDFELRILEQSDATAQHERVIMDESKAYKIPPLNIINKKNEHIVGINYSKTSSRFNDLWARATKFENLRSQQ